MGRENPPANEGLLDQQVRLAHRHVQRSNSLGAVLQVVAWPFMGSVLAPLLYDCAYRFPRAASRSVMSGARFFTARSPMVFRGGQIIALK